MQIWPTAYYFMEPVTPKVITNERRETWRNVALLLLVALVVVGGSFFIDIQDLSAGVARAGIWGPVLLVVLKASTIVFAPLSGSPLYPLAGALFGPWWGLLYIMLGESLGGSIAFWLSRKYGGVVARRFLSQKNFAFLAAALSYMETVKGLLVARVVFSPLQEVVCYAAGLTRIAFALFFIIHTVVGVIPAALLVWFGSALAVAGSSWGILGVFLLGSAASAFGVYIFFRFVHSRALASVEENKV